MDRYLRLTFSHDQEGIQGVEGMTMWTALILLGWLTLKSPVITMYTTCFNNHNYKFSP
jgi:hypothetical protein